MKRIYGLAILALGVLSCGHLGAAKPRVAPGRYVKTLKENGIRRKYVLRIPRGYDNATPVPIVILFHGWSSSAEEIEQASEMGAKADREDFVLAIPDGTEGIGELKGWNSGFLNLGDPKADDVKLTNDILDQAERELYIDPRRVYVAGHSNGAMMAYDVAAKLGDRVAAIAVVSGTIGVPPMHVDAPQCPVSAIIIHGMEDPTIPYDSTTRGLIEATGAKDCAKWWADKDGCRAPDPEIKRPGLLIDDYKGGRSGAEVELITLLKGTHSWPKTGDDLANVSATDMIWDFLKAHPRN